MNLTEFAPYISSVLIFFAVVIGLYPVFKFWDSITSFYLRDFFPHLKLLNIDQQKLLVAMRFWGLALVVVLGGGVALGMPLLAFAITVLILAAPRIILSSKLKKHRDTLRGQLSAACNGLANSARAGLSLPMAIDSVASELPQPLQGELTRISRDYRGGVPLAEAIAAAKERINLDTFSIFAIAITTCLEQGGKVTEMLERIAESISESQRLERKMQSETAAGRRVVWILAVFPLFFLSVMGLLYPSGAKLMFTTLPGQILLVVAIVLVCGSIFWSLKILSIEV